MNRIDEALYAALWEGPADASQIDLAGLTPAEWHGVAALAIRQRVGPLLYSRPRLPMPDEVHELLRARAQTSARHALMQQAAFRELAGAVAPLGISLMALKGLHLATSVYSSASLREMNDIDVLVRPEQVDPVSAVVRQLGYRPMRDVPVSVALQAMHHVPRFLNGSVGLEIHWRLAPPGTAPQVEPDDLWTLTVPAQLSSTSVTLAPEALLVHVCAHAATHHLEQGIRPLCDLQAIISGSSCAFSWPLVLDLAHRWHCERSVALLLSLTKATLGVQMPAAVLTGLAPYAPSAQVLGLAITHTLSDARDVADTPTAAGELLSTPGLWGKARHIRDHIWLPGPAMAILYPKAGTGPLARAVVTIHRACGLVRRRSLELLKLAARWNSPSRAALDRRNALVAWLRQR